VTDLKLEVNLPGRSPETVTVNHSPFVLGRQQTCDFVILAMGVSTCLGFYTNGIIIAGAVLFIISDALIAYPMFVAPITHSSFWVMFTYYAAQALLTYGTLKMKSQR